MQKAVQSGQIVEGHGRALLMIRDVSLRQKAFKKVVEEELSVRAAEALARKVTNGGEDVDENLRESQAPAAKSADLHSLEESLQKKIGNQGHDCDRKSRVARNDKD